MLRFPASSTMVLGLVCGAVFASPSVANPPPVDPAATEVLSLGLRGVYFVPNQGQWSDADVHYGLRSRGVDVAFRESSFTMHLRRETGRAIENFVATASESSNSAQYETLTLGVSFPGSNPVMPHGAEPHVARFNYFVGGKGRGIASDVPSFGAVVYANLYNGIDLHVMGSDEGVLKYEFHVAPGADYGQIRIAYDGIDSLCVTHAGDAQIETAFGTLVDNAPIVWQVIDGDRHAVSAQFDALDDRSYTVILLDAPAPGYPLIVDPDVQWMYFLGGTDEDRGKAISVDSSGSAFLTGRTSSTNFEGRNNSHHTGTWDGFVVKVAADGTLEWMTYIGGSSSDMAEGIATDGDRNALVVGWTHSSDFQGRNNVKHGPDYPDAFVVKLNPTGALQWMTYLGGRGSDLGNGIGVDREGSVFSTGLTDSTDFEGRNNSVHDSSGDAFVTKVSSAGNLQWMTYIGGNNIDFGSDLAVNDNGDALITGQTVSNDGPFGNHHGEWDAFVVKVSSSGVREWGTALGGTLNDIGNSIAVVPSGDVLVVGETDSTSFEGRNNTYHGGPKDGFVASVSGAGWVQWMTYIGGSGSDSAHGVASDLAGSALAVGESDSTDFEGRGNSLHGGSDGFVAGVHPSGSVQWMTYLGGAGSDLATGVDVDGLGNPLLVGTTDSPDFEGHTNSYQAGGDAFVSRIVVREGPLLTVRATCPTGGPIEVTWMDATPSGRVALIFALNLGEFRVPAQSRCQGTLLGLGANQIQLVGNYAAGETGERTVNGFAGNGACGGYLQLLDLTTCATSNVARIE